MQCVYNWCKVYRSNNGIRYLDLSWSPNRALQPIMLLSLERNCYFVIAAIVSSPWNIPLHTARLKLTYFFEWVLWSITVFSRHCWLLGLFIMNLVTAALLTKVPNSFVIQKWNGKKENQTEFVMTWMISYYSWSCHMSQRKSCLSLPAQHESTLIQSLSGSPVYICHVS